MRFTLLITVLTITIVQSQIIDLLRKFVSRGTRQLNIENLDNSQKLWPEYDFIIVGAGTAGCVLANRLTENPKWRVLLIEAGQHENLLMDVPLYVHYLQQSKDVNWGYKTQSSNTSCMGLVNNQCNWPRGKVMGGSSVLNYMIYTRGNRRDYDNWEAKGSTGWSYADVLPYFKKVENNQIPNAATDYKGTNGPVTISYVNFRSHVANAFVSAAQGLGHPYVDYNGPTQIGVSYIQTNTKEGLRESSNKAYLYRVKSRKNLHIKKLAMVTKILLDEQQKLAIGVQFYANGKYYTIKATREVIVTAGAINTPQLLMLSGIGPADHLRDVGIHPMVDLPVGYNLMDHTAPGALTFKVNVSTISLNSVTTDDIRQYNAGNGIFSSPGGCESIAFYDTEHPNDPDGYPDLELLQIDGSVHSLDVLRKNFGIKPKIYKDMFEPMEFRGDNAFMVFPMVLRPKSRGRITLINRNPFQYPNINANYFDDPYDIEIALKGIRKTLELVNTDAFRRINATLLDTPLAPCSHFQFGSDDYWRCYTRHLTFTIYHYSGTCKMGDIRDPTTVVGPDLLVKNIKNLRVADASILPDIMAAHPNAAVFMIGEKAADIIKQSWGFI